MNNEEDQSTATDPITWIINAEESTIEIEQNTTVLTFGFRHETQQLVITAFEKESDVKKTIDICLDIAGIKALRDQLNSLDLPAA